MVSAKKRFQYEVLFVVALWAILSPLVAMPVYERLLFFPDKSDPVKTLGLFCNDPRLLCDSCQQVTIGPTAGVTLSGLYFKLNKAQKVVLVSHGNGGNMGYRAILASALLKSGCSVLLYDYEGYGNSQGRATVPHAVDDACAAFDYLTTVQNIRAGQIIAYGESLGAGITAELSRKRPISAMVLQSTFPSLTWAAHDRLWFTWLYPAQWFPDLDCIAAVRSSTMPLLVIHGTNDAVFPVRYAEIVFKQSKLEKERWRKLAIIPGMTHNLENSGNLQYQTALHEFLEAL